MNEERRRKLKQSALRYTAYRERASKEVADKLQEWDARPEEITQLLKELEEENFIDEERFARAFFHDKFLFNKWGKHRISREIKKYNLPAAIVAKGRAYIDQEEYEKALAKLAEQKWKKLKESELFKKKQKTVNYLTQKGYESDLIWREIGKLEKREKI